ncbi:MAG TPA: solute carrier family 23 protein, partial [Bacillota bacterium]|nr:solute carrier family 23 protein [Bacillota bacterium]
MIGGFGQTAPDDLIGKAQFGIILSGLVSIGVGLLINLFGFKKIERFLPPVVTGPVAMIIGLSLAATAVNQGSGFTALGQANGGFWAVALITLFSIILFTVIFKKGMLSQLPILLGIMTGYLVSLLIDLIFQTHLVDFSGVGAQGILNVPHFTLPVPNWAAVLAIMPIALATIPESTAHLYQIDLYVNELAREKGAVKKYDIADKLGLNLIGDGVGDMVSALVGGPAGTNYGENISTMAITKNFSVWVLGGASIITMLLSFISPLSDILNTIPQAVIGGASLYLFGVIAAQGVAIMIEKKVNMFSSKNLAIIAVILIFGVGGYYGFNGNGSISVFGMNLPAIATASILGIVLNALFILFEAIESKRQKKA